MDIVGSAVGNRLNRDEVLEDEYQDYIVRGNDMMCLMAATIQRADSLLASPSQSRWKYNDLTHYGWSIRSNHRPRIPSDLKDAITQSLGYEDFSNRDAWEYVSWEQNETFEQPPGSGTMHEATDGFYVAWYNRENSGLILATDMISPCVQAVGMGLDAFPDLSRWSDVIFLEWSNQIGGPEAALKEDLMPPLIIMFDNIVTPEVSDLIDTIARKRNLPIPYQFDVWPAFTFHPFEEQYKALMGTVHGRAVGWFLATHKRQFGVKTVVKINAFRSETVDYKRCLAFEIGNVEDDPAVMHRAIISEIEKLE